ncbi:hypothetical protein [Brevundimonas sp. A19_0]|uniref:hypothetical protein n=1 Tax=Brevundimonas sp. A19_0 TaxID=2821087 RepID=UPI001ADCED10|nr:hypothetical protein [Brevundimonas sp. A19_0]MBO9502834.1 hypothetical protein [Brevundimonas sp. A19_0]
MTVRFEDAYPGSKAFLELPALRVPAGWRIALNDLSDQLDPGLCDPDSVLFSATNAATRFEIEVTGGFHLRVSYAPWPRTERGRRIADQPLTFLDGEVVHALATEDYAALIADLQYWIARCSVWVREGN